MNLFQGKNHSQHYRRGCDWAVLLNDHNIITIIISQYYLELLAIPGFIVIMMGADPHSKVPFELRQFSECVQLLSPVSHSLMSDIKT